MNRMTVRTSKKTDFVDITSEVRKAVSKSGIEEGVCTVFVPHTTAGVTINEAADPDVRRDIMKELDKIVPWNDGYAHGEGNSAAHIKTTLTGSSVSIPVEDGSLALGTWQGIYLCEFDGPRSRQVLCTVVPG